MKSIGDAQGFSGKTPIAPSGGFSVETLTGATPLWKTELNRSISPWKTEYLEGCSTAMRRIARKVATVEGGLVWFRGGITTGMQFSGQVDLYVTTSRNLTLFS